VERWCLGNFKAKKVTVNKMYSMSGSNGVKVSRIFFFGLKWNSDTQDFIGPGLNICFCMLMTLMKLLFTPDVQIQML